MRRLLAAILIVSSAVVNAQRQLDDNVAHNLDTSKLVLGSYKEYQFAVPPGARAELVVSVPPPTGLTPAEASEFDPFDVYVRRGARVNGTAEAALAEQSVSAPVWCDHAQCGCAAGACWQYVLAFGACAATGAGEYFAAVRIGESGGQIEVRFVTGGSQPHLAAELRPGEAVGRLVGHHAPAARRWSFWAVRAAPSAAVTLRLRVTGSYAPAGMGFYVSRDEGCPAAAGRRYDVARKVNGTGPGLPVPRWVAPPAAPPPPPPPPSLPPSPPPSTPPSPPPPATPPPPSPPPSPPSPPPPSPPPTP